MCMNYGKFLESIKEKAEYIAGEEGRVTVNHIIKNNGRELDGLVIMERNSNISPTIYLNAYYEEYKNGRSIADIVIEIADIYSANKGKLNFDPDFFNDFDNVKEKIVYKVVNFDKNRRLLEEIPHKRFLDLAVVYYCMLERFADSNATVLINNAHLKIWNVSENDIYNAAVKNTPDLLKSCISPMSSIINNLKNEFDSDFEEDEELCGFHTESNEAGEMYVLTNSIKINGAACIFYKNVLKNFAEKIDSDLYILPSSIHEVILLPKLDMFKRDDLVNMVREVNHEGVSQEEVLSDNVYIYNRREGVISL